MIEVVDPGPLALVEDQGRPGCAALGVGRSGALDRAALRLANRVLGNDEGAAGIEALLGPFTVRFTAPTWCALTGARGGAVLAGRRVEANTAFRAEAGEELRVTAAFRGLRHYLAVRGGVATPRVLGSRSVDTLAGLGQPLQIGDLLPVGGEPTDPIPAVDTASIAAPGEGIVTVLVLPGPRADWFTPEALRLFSEVDWVVASRSDRVGLTLEAPPSGRPLERARADELPSEAMVAGSVQVTHAGTPTILLADHPVTGGYPVIAVVREHDLDVLAQLAPGRRLRFVP